MSQKNFSQQIIKTDRTELIGTELALWISALLRRPCSLHMIVLLELVSPKSRMIVSQIGQPKKKKKKKKKKKTVT